MKYAWAFLATIGQSCAAEILTGIPTVPFTQSNATGAFGLAHVQSIVVDERYASYVDHDGETLIPPTLKEFATTFAEDLQSALGLGVDVTTGSIQGHGKHIVLLTLDTTGAYTDAAGLPTSEGYTLSVSDAGITISGASPLGVWWGTRTVLQQAILSLGQGGVPTVPHGVSVDSPGWSTRGMMLDAGRHYYPADFLVELCSYMSFFKQNVLHLHVSDNLYNNPNYTRKQSLELYARFRLWSEDEAVAGLNRYANESYDRATFDGLQAACARRGITVLPEIEAPGHALVFTQWKPEIALDTDISLLNISHPETLPTVKAIWGTFLPWFHCKTVSIGADEYTGPEADYNAFVNDMDTFIAAESGKSIRIWGTFPPIYNATWMNVYQNVSVQHWEYFEDNPYYDYIKNNYSVVNSNDDFYVVNKWAPAGGYLNHINLTKTFYGSPDHSFWRPHVFDQNNATNNPAASDPNVLGSIVPMWNDYGSNTSVYSEAYYAWKEGIPALADKQWGGNLTEAAFAGVFDTLLPKIPGQNLERTIASKTDVIFNYTLEGLAPGAASIEDASPNKYTAHTDCRATPGGTRGRWARPGSPGSNATLSIANNCSLVTPLESKGRNYTLTLGLVVQNLTDATNATLLAGRDSTLMLTPNITLLSGGNYYRLNSTVPLGSWFQLSLIGRGNRTFAAVDNGPEMQFLTEIGYNGINHHWAEIAIEAPLRELGGKQSGWSGLFGGMSLTSTA